MGEGCGRGGIVGLARVIQEHGEALSFDLLVNGLGAHPDEIITRHGWRALSIFTRWLPPSSALYRSVNNEAWRFEQSVPYIMADLIDELRVLRYEFEAVHSKGAKPPKPYPRPGMKDPNQRIIGSDPIPVKDFEEWWATE